MRETLRACLVEAGHAVVACGDLSAAPRLFAALDFDLICLDARDDAGGDDFWAWFLADQGRASVPVLFVLPPGAKWTPGAATGRLRFGQDDFLLRPVDVETLKEKVARLLAASPSAARGRPRLLRSPPFALDAGSHDLEVNGRKVALTPIEYRLLAYLMERPGTVVGSGELLESVWGFQPGTATAEVVRVHVGNLRRKMGRLGAAQFLETLPHRGYRLLEENNV
jgi:two-component system phosphate regulon response regulator PhoB